MVVFGPTHGGASQLSLDGSSLVSKGRRQQPHYWRGWSGGAVGGQPRGHSCLSRVLARHGVQSCVCAGLWGGAAQGAQLPLQGAGASRGAELRVCWDPVPGAPARSSIPCRAWVGNVPTAGLEPCPRSWPRAPALSHLLLALAPRLWRGLRTPNTPAGWSEDRACNSARPVAMGPRHGATPLGTVWG